MKNDISYIPLTKNAILSYTVTLLPARGKARIHVYPQTVDGDNNISTHRNSQKTVICGLRDVDSYREYLEQRKAQICREFLLIAEKETLEVTEC